MIKKLSTALCVALFLQTPFALAQDWQMDKAKSSLKYSLTAQGSAVGGDFSEFDTQITLNPDDVSSASIKATINVASVTASSEQAVSTGLSSSWLSAANFPTVSFQSTKVTKTGDNSYKVEGELAVKDLKKPFSFPFTLNVDGNKAIAKADFKLERALFNLGGAGDAGPHINIKISIEAAKK